MGKIFYLMGKSASGKDTVYARLLSDPALNLRPLVPYTTRPPRTGEEEGREYHFVNEAQLEDWQESGKVIELRTYHTVHGPWHYFTPDDHQADGPEDCIAIGTPESFWKLKGYFGEERVVSLYLEVEDGIRLDRALQRERTQRVPEYEEMCRRFLADQKDFSEEALEKAGIVHRFDNNSDFEICMRQIRSYILLIQQQGTVYS